MLDEPHLQALDRLRTIVADLGSVLVTFSGGVDSALVLAVAHEQLGDRAVGLTAVSPTFPPEELAEAERVVALLGARAERIDSHELEREGYVANAGNRCYFCKSELFELAQARAVSLGLRWVADGTLVEDLGGHRPGQVAATENQVRHPLVEAGLSKAQVRALAQHLGLPVWDKPAFACLGSRFPVGTAVTPPRLLMVQRVESRLRALGLRQFRARWHELEGHPLVRIEIDPQDMAFLVQDGVRESVMDACTAEGFRFVTLDLQGFRSGGLSHAL